MRVVLVIVLLFLAGCATPSQTAADACDEAAAPGGSACVSGSQKDAKEGGSSATPSPNEPVSEARPKSADGKLLLIDLTDDTLRERAAEAIVPAGQYGIFRFIMTGAMYDGNAASGSYEWAMSAEGPDNGVVMVADAWVSPFAKESDPVTPSTTFYDLGSTWMTRGGSYSCSGCDHPARNQLAWLVGSPDGDITFRFGIATTDVEALRNREAVSIDADAFTESAFAGASYYAWSVGSEYDQQSGVLHVTHSGPGPNVARAQRVSTFAMDEVASERGVFAMQLYVNDPVGQDQWQFEATAAGYDDSISGSYVHSSPYGSFQSTSGLLYKPIVTLQSIVDAGPISLTGERTYTGVEDLVGVPLFNTIERANVGWAGLDLAALYGWEMTLREPTDAEGYAMETETNGPLFDVLLGE